MTKITFLLLICFSFSNAQINVTKTESDVDEMLEKLKTLENKEVFIAKPHYMEFYNDYKDEKQTDKSFSRDGEYFNVLNVFKYKCETTDCIGSYVDLMNDRKYMVKLIRKTDNDTLYLKKGHYLMDDFTIVDDFNNLKKEYVGKKYVSRGVNFSFSGTKDISTKENITLNSGEVWEITDYTLDLSEITHNKRFILQKDNVTISVAKDYVLDKTQFFSIEESEKYLSEYGETNWNKILAGKVVIGFTKEMCELSWGKPKDINISSHSPEQWVYEDSYLYFKDGKLVAFN